MELVVHGTKGGFRTLYSTPNAPSIASDIRNNVGSENALGRSLYAIAFAENGCVFTKYSIVRDTLRSYATGTIAFSLFLPAKKELSGKGADVKSLLDKLSRYYADKYMKENNINRGETNIIQEDWSFVSTILSEYKEENKTWEDEEFHSGAKDAAFIYYFSDEELQKYFDDAPFREEYRDYKQVFFVEKRLEGKPENPLNALRHSENDLTGKIDLENTQYTLFFNQQANSTVRIEVKENGSLRSNRSKIRRKNDLEISWSKPYYKTKELRGKLYEIRSEYIIVNDNDRTVLIKENKLLPEEKTITLVVKDCNGNPITGAEIQFGTQSWQEIRDHQCKYTFKGENIGKHWDISARKESDHLFSESISIVPENQVDAVLLILHKQKTIKIFAIDKDGNNITDFEFWINDGQGYRKNVTKWIFKEDDVEKNWIITISKKEGRDSYSGRIEYCPANGENPLYVTIEKKTKRQNDKANKQSKSFDNKPKESKFRKMVRKIASEPFAWVISVFAVIAMLVIIYEHEQPTMDTEKTVGTNRIEKNEVISYIEGPELSLDVLEDIKTRWENNKPKAKRNYIWYNPITWLGDGKQTIDTIESKDWLRISQEIENTINKLTQVQESVTNDSQQSEIRSEIQNYLQNNVNLNFDQVKKYYSKNGLGDELNNSLKLVNNTFWIAVQTGNTDFSFIKSKVATDINLQRNQFFVDFLEKICNDDTYKQKYKNVRNKNQIKSLTDLMQKIDAANSTDNTSGTGSDSTNHNHSSTATTNNSSSPEKTKDISVELQGAHLNPKKLSEYEEANFSKFSNSIKLYRNFFILIKEANHQKDNFTDLLKSVKKDNFLKNSELKNFLELICKDSRSFEEFYNNRIDKIPKSDRERSSLSELKNKLQ